MEIPTPPTDSLYKFRAIGGIIMMLGSTYICYKTLHDITERQTGVASEILITETEKAVNKDNMTIIGNDLTRIESAFNRLPPLGGWSDKDKNVGQVLSDQVSKVRSLFDRTTADWEAIRRRIAILEGRANALHESVVEMRWVLVNCLIMLLYGGYLTTWGFLAWGRKIQEPQDELLQIQLEQARLALAKAKAEITASVQTTERDARVSQAVVP